MFHKRSWATASLVLIPAIFLIAAPQKSKQTQLARGKYLVEGPALCLTCHSQMNFTGPNGARLAGPKGAGARFPDETVPFPLYAPNITPDRETGIGSESDEQIARAIRGGIGKDGRQLFPVMPYLLYRNMSDEDLAAVITYLRSLPPVRNQVPANAIPPPAKAMMPPLPPAPEHVAPRDQSSAVKRGEYLATIGTCTDCHTPVDEHGAPIRDLIFAGGRELKGPWGDVAGANITPDASGISYYDEKQFIRVIRTGHVGARKLNNIMLWPNYARMTDSDLKDLFAYLRSLPPVHHRVDNSLPPTYCRICKGRHGGGDQN